MEPKTWIVTGGNRGIGLEFVRQLQARGEDVIATARDPEAATELCELGVRVEQLDVADPVSVAGFAALLEGESVDVLLNNAGAMERAGELGSIDYDTLRRQFDVNTLGPLRMIEAALPALRLGGRKLIATLTSKMGSITDNTSGGSYAYRTSKTALNMVNRSVSVDLAGEGFTCVVLHPGWVQTAMGGENAPLDVAASVTGMLKVLDGADAGHNGRFFNYDGEELPW
jgi:NAD(P)-dependent dehydrogenase (short-subunit alcohol dehydrogenase family)